MGCSFLWLVKKSAFILQKITNNKNKKLFSNKKRFFVKQKIKKLLHKNEGAIQQIKNKKYYKKTPFVQNDDTGELKILSIFFLGKITKKPQFGFFRSTFFDICEKKTHPVLLGL